MIEWAEKVKELLPEDRLWVRLAFGERALEGRGSSPTRAGIADSDRREIIWEATGSRSEALLSAADLEATIVTVSTNGVG